MIYYAPRLSCCPKAMAAAKRATAELLAAGHTTLGKVEPYLEAMFEYRNGRVAGIVCFFLDEGNAYYASIVWVDPRNRGEGIYKSLLRATIKHCRKNKAKTLTTDVHNKNTRMIEVMTRHWGPSYVYFTKRL